MLMCIQGKTIHSEKGNGGDVNVPENDVKRIRIWFPEPEDAVVRNPKPAASKFEWSEKCQSSHPLAFHCKLMPHLEK